MLKPEQVGPWMGFWHHLANEFGLAVLLTGHEPKAAGGEPSLRNLFGSVNFGAKVDSAFGLARVMGKHDTFRLKATKWRWGPESEGLDLTFSMDSGPSGGLVLISEETEALLLKLLFNAVPAGDEWTLGTDAGEQFTEKFTDRGVRDAFATLVRHAARWSATRRRRKAIRGSTADSRGDGNHEAFAEVLRNCCGTGCFFGSLKERAKFRNRSSALSSELHPFCSWQASPRRRTHWCSS